MICVSFAMTSEAYADRTKTETRRFWKAAHAAKFRPGVEFMGITKDFRAGGVRMHSSRVEFCRQERLGDMTEESFVREGGARYWPNREAYIAAMGGPDLAPWVLRFEHVADSEPAGCVCGCEYFVWWIREDGRYSSETPWECYDRERHPRAVCRDCSRYVQRNATLTGGKNRQKEAHE